MDAYIIGLEPLLQYELVKLKVGNRSTCVYTEYGGGVEADVNIEQFWRLLCCSRMIESVRVRVGKFSLEEGKSISDCINRIPWKNYLSSNDIVKIQTRVVRNGSISPEEISNMITKDTVIPSMVKAITDLRIPNSKKVFFLVKRGTITVSVDTGYDSVRGYREFLADTPLKETLAAALCYDAITHGCLTRNNMVVFDFFCGSGVLSDELYSILNHDYPYLQRKRLMKEYHHGFESWPNHHKAQFDMFVSALEKDREKRPLIRDYKLMNSDIAARAMFCSQSNTMNILKPQTCIPEQFSFSQVDFDSRCKEVRSLIASNPDMYKDTFVILANPPIYMKNSISFSELDALYRHLFDFICELKREGLLRHASLIIPETTEQRLSMEMLKIATIKPLKLGEHSVCILSV